MTKQNMDRTECINLQPKRIWLFHYSLLSFPIAGDGSGKNDRSCIHLDGEGGKLLY